MTCAEFASRVDSWLAGELTEADARQVEAHAAECPSCGEKLDALSSVGTLPRDLPPPPAIRPATLRAIHSRRIAGRWRRVAASVVGIAAIALLAIMVQPRRKSASDFPGAGRELLARAHARPEFAELDRAERDLDGALKQHPSDAELSAALARVRRQRGDLQRLVQQANQ